MAAGLTDAEIAQRLLVSSSTVQQGRRRHDRWLAESPRYADLVVRAVRSAVRRSMPPARHLFELSMRVRCGSEVAAEVRGKAP